MANEEILKGVAQRFRVLPEPPKIKQYYVYHDRNMVIAAISPIEDNELSKNYQHALVSSDEVQDYLEGNKCLRNTILVNITATDKYYITKGSVRDKHLYFILNQMRPILPDTSGSNAITFSIDHNKITVDISNRTDEFIARLERCREISFFAVHEQDHNRVYKDFSFYAKDLRSGKLCFDAVGLPTNIMLVAEQPIEMRMS